MGTLSRSRPLRFFTFTILYFAQGLPWGFIAKGYVVFMTDAGLDNLAVGSALGLAYAPWSFKILFGPFIDHFPSRLGRRRHFIIAAQLMMGATLLSLLGLDPATQLGWMTAILFFNNCFAALQDVAVDALAVDALELEERGRANSFMWAGKSAGVLAGGSGGLLLARFASWPVVFVAMALAVWVIVLVPILVRERPAEETGPSETQGFRFSEIRRSFSFAAPRVGLLISLLTPVGYSLVAAIFTRMQRAHLGFSENRIAALGVLEQGSAIGGALLGGFLADRFGQRRTIGACMLGMGTALGLFAALPSLWASLAFLAPWIAVQQLLIYAYSAATLGFFMTLSNPAIGATQFALFMAGTNVTYAWTAPAAGWIADQYGYPAIFAVAAAAQAAQAGTIALLPFCDPMEAERRFRGRITSTSETPQTKTHARPG